MQNNPLVQAPHVPKRVGRPEWGRFVDTAASGHQPRHTGKSQAGRSSVWAQTRAEPYADTPTPLEKQQDGPLKPAWLSQHQPAQHDTQQGLTTAHQLQPGPQQQHADSTQLRPHHSATLATAQQSLASFHQGAAAGAATAGVGVAQAGPGWVLPPRSDGQTNSQQHRPQQQQGQEWHVPPKQPALQQHAASKPWQQSTSQQRQPQQQPHPLQGQQQQQQELSAASKPARGLAAWEVGFGDDDDDVQLPDSWWDSQGPGQAAGQAKGRAAAAAAPAAGGGAGRSGSQDLPFCSPGQAGNVRQAQGQAGGQHQPGVQQQQQQYVAGQQQSWQRQPPHLSAASSAQPDTWPPRQQPQQDLTAAHLPNPQLSTAYQHSAHRAQQQQASYPQQHQQHQQRQTPWQQQRQQAGQHAPAQQQQQQRTAAASLWSDNTSMAGLSRVPAAGGGPGAAAAAAAGWDAAEGTGAAAAATAGKQRGGKAGAGGGAAAAAAAAAGGTKAGAAKPRAKGSRAAAKSSKGNSSSTSSSGAVTREFVPKAPGDTSQQPKLHQTTLFDTLKRAQQNKQREQQQQQDEDSEQQDDQQDVNVQQQQQQQQQQQHRSHTRAGAAEPPAKATGAAAARKRRRSSTAAVAGSAAAGSGGVSGGAASGGRAGASGGGRANKAARLSKTAAALEAAVEELDTWWLNSSSDAAAQQQQGSVDIMLDASLAGSAAWRQLQQALATAEGVALGVLYSSTVPAPAAAAAPLAVQYFSSLQPPYKQQQALLTKAASYAKRQAAAAAASGAAAEVSVGTAGQAEQEAAADAAGAQQVVGLAVMPFSRRRPGTAAAAAAAAVGQPSFFISLQQQQQQQQGLPEHVLQLLQSLLCDADKRPCVCCNAKAVLCSLADQGLQLPAASSAAVVDPELLGWMLDSQLIQDSKNEACYTLEQQLSRHGMRVLGVEGLGPLQRLHQQLRSSLDLAAHLHTQVLNRGVAGQAIKLEMQVAVLLAKMEVSGVACAPAVLSDHRAVLAGRLAAIKGRATQLVGFEFNLSSSSQLAKVLYEDLRLTPPAGGGGRSAAKTHLPTNEAALKQLSLEHDLPSLVLEHRCIVNVMSKWIDAPWVQAAAQQPGGRVRCTWQQTSTATGRLSSCSPNLQAVTKYSITAQQGSEQGLTAAAGAAAAGGGGAEAIPGQLSINVRDAFVAPAGKLLLSADYSQIELRLLAHFSEDRLLRHILNQSQGDVFNMIAAALQQAGNRQQGWLSGAAGAAAPQVSPAARDQAKRVVYGIVYGLTAFGLAQQLADQGVSTAAAQAMIDGFLRRFSGVDQFIQQSVRAARGSGAVKTLMGRRRPIPGLTGDLTERSAAERKVVNSQIQGSAADLIKLAMCAWDEWAAQQQQQQQQGQEQQGQEQAYEEEEDAEGTMRRLQVMPPGMRSSGVHARLIAQIHDELLFEIDAADAQLDPDGSPQQPGRQFLQVAAAVKALMEGAAPLAVPLRVKLAWGASWGSLAGLEL